MNENQTNEVLNLSKNGLSSRAIAKKLGISKSKAHNIIRDNRIKGQEKNTSIPLNGQEQIMPTTSNGQEQNTSIMPNGQQQNIPITSNGQQINTSISYKTSQEFISTLSQLPENVAFLVKHYTLPTDTEENVMGNIIAVRRHLESKRIYNEFIDTMEYICYTSLLSFDEIDEYILKLKTIAKDTDKLISSMVIGVVSKNYRLTAFYSNELMKHLYYKKGECKAEGKSFCELDDDSKLEIERYLSLAIKDLFVTYDDYCAEVEANFNL